MTLNNDLPTHFAPAARADAQEVSSQAMLVQEDTKFGGLLDRVPDLVMVLNRHRQVVYANRTLLDLLGVAMDEEVRGRRPGEILGCRHAAEMPGGCGTSEACRHCGAVLAILASLDGRRAVQECRLTVAKPDGEMESLDLQIWATPAKLEGVPYSFVAVSDVSDQKRRRALERIFFHDILNTAGGLRGFASLLRQADGEDLPVLVESLLGAAEQLVQEIQTQRDLLAAESRELKVSPQPVSANAILRQMIRLHGEAGDDYRAPIRLSPPALDITFTSDPTLLGRVLGNMIKNALEAGGPRGQATVGFAKVEDGLEFWVHNREYMPPEVRLQVFKRSFSTKDASRGLGTYGMKLIGERYLKGKVSFVTDPVQGTTFHIRLPMTLAG